MPYTYLALTAGPILKTLRKARSTKELWAASYFFSYLMKQVVRHFRLTHRFISPVANEDALFEPQGGAGLFPDRLLFKQAQPDDLEVLTATCARVVAELSRLALEDVNRQLRVDFFTTPPEQRTLQKPDSVSLADLEAYLSRYLKLYALEITLAEGENCRERIDRHLNVLELQAPVVPPESVDYLSALLRSIYGAGGAGTFLLHDGFGPEITRPFPSLIEIATDPFRHTEHGADYQALLERELERSRNAFRHLAAQDVSDPIGLPSEEDLVSQLKALMGNSFKMRHKYIAIVQADGDGLGKINQAIFEDRTTEAGEALMASVDKRLLNFSLEAIRKIRRFGGRPVYIGGDDLLFFAPVEGLAEAGPSAAPAVAFESVFGLINRLSAAFDEQFADDEFHDTDTNGGRHPIHPRLSFGVSITYHKFPLFEALDEARHLLEGLAKERPGKNALAFRVLKHSGQAFGTTYAKTGDVLTIHLPALVANAAADSTFLASVQYKIQALHSVLTPILDQPDRLKNFFDNNFDEPNHSASRDFLDSVARLIHAAYLEEKQPEAALTLAYATLRFVQFLNQDDRSDDD